MTVPRPEPPKLDPRPARTLTSRECCKVLGGLIGGLHLSGYFGNAGVRSCVSGIAENQELWDKLPISSALEERTIGGVFDPTYGVALAALAGSLAEIGGKKNARIAFRWWARRDDVWDAFE